MIVGRDRQQMNEQAYRHLIINPSEDYEENKVAKDKGVLGSGWGFYSKQAARKASMGRVS